MTKRLIITEENLKKFFGPDEPIMYFNSSIALTNGIGSNNFSNKVVTQVDKFTHNLFVYIDEEKRNSGTNYKYLLFDKNLVTEVELEDLTNLVKPILDKFMPNRYHIINQNIYLYYPEFTITNDIGETNVIRDLVVEIKTKEDQIKGISGNRYTFSEEELDHRYRHSHLPLRRDDEFSNFCLGGGSDVKAFVDKLGTSCTADQFELLLAQLDHYLVWESRAGKPHISISTFYTVGNVDTDMLLPQDLVNELAVKFINNLNPNWLNKFDDGWFFDPAMVESEVYKLELKLVDESYIQYCYNFDPTTNRYVKDTTTEQDRVRELPELTELSKTLVKKFNITPRITKNPKRFTTNSTIKRLSPQDLGRVFNQINDLLKSNEYVNGEAEITA